MIFRHTLVLTFSLLTAAAGWAQHKTDRIIKAEYPIGPEDLIELRMQQADVRIHTGSSAEARLEMTLEAEGSTPERAADRLAMIDVRERHFGGKLQIETHLVGQRLLGLPLQSGIRITVDLYVPAACPVELTLSGGSAEIGHRSGNVNLTLAYADLKAGHLAGMGNRISLDWGKAIIDTLGGGDVSIRGGSLEVQQAEMLYIYQVSARVKAGTVGDLTLNSQLGSLKVTDVSRITGTYLSSDVYIGRLGQTAVLQGRYAPALEIATIAPGFDTLDLRGNAAAIHLGMEPDARFELDATLERGTLTVSGLSGEMTEETDAASPQVHRYRITPPAHARMASPPGYVRIQGNNSPVTIEKSEPVRP